MRPVDPGFRAIFEDSPVGICVVDKDLRVVNVNAAYCELLGRTEAEVMAATTEPPASTRAYFRGMCLSRWPDSVVAANWDSIILDVGGDPLKRIPMMEPLKGTKAHVESLFANAETPADLVGQLAQ